MERVRFSRDITVSGDGLILRDWTDEDVTAMIELFDDPLVDRWTPLVSPFDLAAARAYLAASHRSRADDRGIQLAITTDGDQACGEVLLFRTGQPDEAELAYAVGPAFRGRRLAPRAVRIMTGYGYDELGLSRLLLRIDPGNLASESVAGAAGFELTDEPIVVRPRPAGNTVRLRTWLHRRLSTVDR
ncbi:RimJ/RimL family protein N-acetyltransferase [Stackebrandtia endophytica]|uniref:RimJ/RimL family protein N-acetyltransferase n=1 Tax=Stackebrandtia endophytica TaxID=1496996 RepID=A0A543B130_9ACTN|nr:GNAT family N-acetyltransferase [Stackebrandtia endophytica]TQL78534.1 RimJ/RimL family protein N-acetyltransferase [Stackebrandtia endophytica]